MPDRSGWTLTRHRASVVTASHLAYLEAALHRVYRLSPAVLSFESEYIRWMLELVGRYRLFVFPQ